MALHGRRAVLASVAAGLAGCLAGRGADPSGTRRETTDPTAARTSSPDDTPVLAGVDGEWTHPRADAAGTRAAPGGRVADAPPRVAWTAEYGGEWGSVAVADGRLVVVDEGLLLALDAATGEPLWRHSLTPGADVAGPVLSGDLLVGVGSELRALSPADGSRRWTVDAGSGTVEYVAALAGTVYATTEGTRAASGAVHAVRDGELLWTFRTDEVPVARFGSLAVADGTVYAVGISGGSATWHHALDAATGEGRWRADGLNHSTALTVAGETVLAGGFYGRVVAQATADGSQRWERELPPDVRQLCVDDGRVYAASSADEAGSLTALSPADGSTLWRDRGRGVSTAGDGLVVVGPDGLRGVEASTGMTRWVRRRTVDVRGLALADGAVFVVLADGAVAALTAQ